MTQRAVDSGLFTQSATTSFWRSGKMSEVHAATNREAAVRRHVPTVLTVAGSDSGGGAGIQADLKTFAANGVFGTTAITALTAQNTRGVSGVHGIPPRFVAEQIAAVLDDIPVDVIKTGMLPTIETVQQVAIAVQQRQDLQLVVDPVLVTTSGHDLATEDVGRAIAEQLFPLATVVTPNLSEASALLGGQPVHDLQSMESAAKALHSMGPKFVLVKGGHLEDENQVADVLYDGRQVHVMPGPRIRTSNTHGTGCTTASAVAAFLARGLSAPQAVRAARAYVTEALARSAHLRIGTGRQQPFNHLFVIDDWRHAERPLDLRLYAVTDPACNARCGRSNAKAVAAAIEGGATVVQLREKNADGGDFCREAEAVLSVTQKHGVNLLINDRIDVALAVGADGVHVGQDDIPAALARRLLGGDKILGVSVKTVEQARRAEAEGADYLGAGAVHRTATKDSSTISLETLQEICAAVRIPVVAIGGITAENAPPCLSAGCSGVAVVSAIFGAEDPKLAASHIRAVLDSKERNNGDDNS